MTFVILSAISFSLVFNASVKFCGIVLQKVSYFLFLEFERNYDIALMYTAVFMLLLFFFYCFRALSEVEMINMLQFENQIGFPVPYIGVTKQRKCFVGSEKSRLMTFLVFHEIMG